MSNAKMRQRWEARRKIIADGFFAGDEANAEMVLDCLPYSAIPDWSDVALLMQSMGAAGLLATPEHHRIGSRCQRSDCQGLHDPERPTEDPDEALARVLYETECEVRWEGAGAVARDTYLDLARAARKHIEAEREEGGYNIRRAERERKRRVKAEAERDALRNERDSLRHVLGEERKIARAVESVRDGWKDKHAALRDDVERGAHYWNSYESSGKHTQNVARAAGYDLTAYLDRDDEWGQA